MPKERAKIPLCDLCRAEGAEQFAFVPTSSRWIPLLDVDVCAKCELVLLRGLPLNEASRYDALVEALKLLIVHNSDSQV